MSDVKKYIAYLKKSVCSKCAYLTFGGEICGGEVMPTERAILKNLDGRGCCSDIKDIRQILEEQKNDSSRTN